ncbi:E3 ubiquitin-protein ligase MARCH8 [Larimichthys crocea]|uniref:Uncharacterized protein n=1 Tax=Larimichthys crocea TaxID=215358 RepID=A0ACD3QBJ1_LARCR|nr:E3 ubiquitin-protein ligase MARCH8 [Larimichthys crocea]
MNMPLHQISVIPRDVTSSRVSGSGKAKDKDKQNEKPLGHSASRSSNISKAGSPTSVNAPCSFSRTSVSPSSQDICRICHCEGDDESPLITPCHCTGSLRFVHQSCLQQWIKSSDTRCCELCKYEFIMETKLKPAAQVGEATDDGEREKEDHVFGHLSRHCHHLRGVVALRSHRQNSRGNQTSLQLSSSLLVPVLLITSIFTKVVTSLVTDRLTLPFSEWCALAIKAKNGDGFFKDKLLYRPLALRILEWPFWTKLVVVAIGFTGGLVFMYVQCKVYIHLWRRLKAYNRVIYVQNRPDTCKKLAAGEAASHGAKSWRTRKLWPPPSRTQTPPSTQRQRTTVWRCFMSDHSVHAICCPTQTTPTNRPLVVEMLGD